MFIKHFTVLFLLAGIAVSCGESGADEEKEDLIEDTDTVKSTVLNVGGELFSVPSPIQTALLIQKSGISYDKNVLNSANRVNTYSGEFLQALNLGIYGADLGYVSLYNQTQDALGYLASIKQLSDKLGLSAAFDGPTMDRIKNNLTNKDSMMTLVGLAYRGSDAYLKNSQRNDISSLILAGGWLESMHFSFSAYAVKPSDGIRYRIAEQKQALNSLLKIISTHTSQDAINLSAKLAGIAKIYEGITFKYQYEEPRHDTVKKLTYINSSTKITVSDEQLKQIGEKIEEIRNTIVNTTQS